jgi:hypothetical protein
MSRRRPSESSGTFGITSPGVSERVDTSAPGLGAALSKAQTIAVRLQRELRDGDDDAVTITIRPLGGEIVGRVIVRRDVVETYATV